MIDCQPLISIILPVYNGEKFVTYAIESVLHQTYPCWELLIVDDGSTDGTAGICDAFALSDKRISVFHQPNGGVNTARAKGIDNSSGDYIVFLDADDTLPEDSLQRSIDSIYDGVSILAEGYGNMALDKERYAQYLISGRIGPALWGKMFASSVVKSVDYHLDPAIRMGEDLLLNLILSLHSDHIRIISDRIYFVNHSNDQSVTRTFKKTWEYEKYYFHQMEDLFLDKCKDFSNYEDIVFYVNKSRLNGIKYVMLDGNDVCYRDKEFLALESYFKSSGRRFGVSERLVFLLKDSSLYSFVIRLSMRVNRRVIRN